MRILLFVIIVVFCLGNIFSQSKDSPKMQRKPIGQVFKEHQERLLSIPSVQGFYQGQLENGDNCIVIMIESENSKIRHALPDTLEGYPVKIEVTGRIKPLDKENKSPEK